MLIFVVVLLSGESASAVEYELLEEGDDRAMIQKN